MGPPFFPCSIPGRSRAPHRVAPQQLLPKSCPALGDSPSPGADPLAWPELWELAGSVQVCPSPSTGQRNAIVDFKTFESP